ncbi:hypothetical protein A2716_04945 [candidate division WWE3 bacterium RIFCSPHIGHO2_01_FULL_40_23]|uniref:Uncharacterized protein n=1 Tax=candidate division WWE3 bacterium RIFCSPLOWO2_01_FULL_41_18 TaxID=1802625 RepID=A0A1F4VDI3_UNCKA|nr:MAG: hypothetical protein A2716_04945 [candidate division WWE3 bacterium RIFCSPHIGHO2_01_FULL_40_23]OGC55217.1 MAG: hypothetical protein A3A78_04555 [candidate division WWE3 bacterium RIFCSPLOWO2_01_FULL_41_18]
MAKKTWPRTPEVNEMFVVALDPDEAYSFFVEGSSEAVELERGTHLKFVGIQKTPGRGTYYVFANGGRRLVIEDFLAETHVHPVREQ